MPQAPLICIFQCRLRIPSGRFLSGDVLRVVEDLYEVRSGFCQRSILHLFRDRRIQKRNAPFLHTEKANLNKLRGCSIEKWLIERIDDKCESKYDQYTQLFSRLAKDIDTLAKA